MNYIFTVVLLTAKIFITLQAKAPKLENVIPKEGYHAIVKETERQLEVTPRIKVVNAEVCNFLITNKHHGDVPFVAEITNKEEGEVVLVAKRELNCEKRKTYKFDIAAVGCDGQISENVTVHVTVEDVNEFPPTFLHESYTVDVNEGELHDQIVQVKAEDGDCSQKFRDICKYEIITPNQPFTIDSEGRIKNTEPLSWDQSRNHILLVVAYDCGMKRSKPTTVNIKVHRVCRPGWKGIRERIEYTPSSGQQILFPEAQLELCDAPCTPEKLTTKVTLSTHHIGKGCDRDTYSVDSQRKLCGASSDSIDLLPSPGIGAEWTRELPTDEGHESDQIYEFDGVTNAVVIPESTLNHNLTNNFTVAFWMKHEPLPDHNNSHMKEHIICNADDHKMNRHHYAIFVRNCRLILLLRREFYQKRPIVFRPAEWRWKTIEVCDNQWHHYAISVNFPEAVLYIDGQAFHSQTDNPEIIDDWPMHATKGINTTFVVGACWQGKQSKMDFHFRGFLAGLSVLRGHTESPDVLACLHHCKEGLEVPPTEHLEPGMELQSNSDLTEVTIDGNSKTNLEELVAQLAYINSREFPTPGRRSLHLSTSVMCSDGKQMKIPTSEAFVIVLQPEQLTIAINGTPNVPFEYEYFKQGIMLFSSISITVSKEQDELNQIVHSSTGSTFNQEHKLDSCTVQVYPPLNPDHEYFILPTNLMSHLGILHKQNKDGLVIYGSDTIHNYEMVLREVHYFNRKPAYYLNRAFKLVCSELNGRFSSNEYVQMVTVIHPQSELSHEIKTTHLPPLPVAHAQVSGHEVEFKNAKIKQIEHVDSNIIDASKAVAKTSASHAVTIIIVVCVGFLVFMIVLGVIRIRAAHHHSHENRDEEQEMAWDDSSLTITVNPMDQIEQKQETQKSREEDNSDSSDDGSSYHDDGESSEEEPEKTKGRELEWDDSTLSF
ncbi:calsyntenin-1-like isoform X2 [Centruroides sculpturatus]|uniref:calsyntenin-1-like isoform X2 n=2 Tax=Centruroides sculpturatus TaxID=218467 RepID=UPI000C6DB50D|nr:calsyntenin-1-like isoform X2 [Centruroides sculpturatus]